MMVEFVVGCVSFFIWFLVLQTSLSSYPSWTRPIHINNISVYNTHTHTHNSAFVGADKVCISVAPCLAQHFDVPRIYVVSVCLTTLSVDNYVLLGYYAVLIYFRRKPEITRAVSC